MYCAVLAIVSSVLSPVHELRLGQDPDVQDAAAIYRNSIESVVWVTNEGDGFSAIGTGFVVYDNSTIATAWHVIKDAEKLTVRFSDGTEVKVDGVVGVDRAADLALLRIRETGRKPLAIRKSDPDIGEQVFAIGNPRGLDFSIADGIVSQMRELYGKKHYQHSIPTTQGNSGGPILDVKGRVVGIQRSGVRGESALKFASAAFGLDEFDRERSSAPMPAALSGTLAWKLDRRVIDRPQPMVGQNEVLLVSGSRFQTIDLKTGEIRTDKLVPTKYMPTGFAANSDGSVVAIRHGAFRMAVLHRNDDGEYSKREDASALWNEPLITNDGTVYNIGGTLSENQSISNMRLEATDAAKGELLWHNAGSDVADLASGPDRGLMLLQSKYLVLYNEDFDATFTVYDAVTGVILWKSERLSIPAGSPLGLIYYNTVQYAATFNVETGEITVPPRYIKGVDAATGKEIYSRKGIADKISVGPDGTVYLSQNGDLLAMNPELTQVKWRTRLGSSVSNRATFDGEGSLFATLKDGRLVALDSETGRLRWSYSGGEEWYFSDPVSIEDGVVIAKTKHGTILAIHD